MKVGFGEMSRAMALCGVERRGRRGKAWRSEAWTVENWLGSRGKVWWSSVWTVEDWLGSRGIVWWRRARLGEVSSGMAAAERQGCLGARGSGSVRIGSKGKLWSRTSGKPWQQRQVGDGQREESRVEKRPAGTGGSRFGWYSKEC